MNEIIETVEFNLPAHWASYLINGDSSGISEKDIEQCDAFCNLHNIMGCAVDCGESFFHWRNDANTLGGDARAVVSESEPAGDSDRRFIVGTVFDIAQTDELTVLAPVASVSPEIASAFGLSNLPNVRVISPDFQIP